MVRVGHFAIPVANLARSREWYVKNFEFQIEIDLSEHGIVEKVPQKLHWGYGAELRDPDGYLVSVWDERSMREKGGG